MTITLDLPVHDSLQNLDQEYLKTLLICNLYNLGKLSAKEAREVLGITRKSFDELLPKFGLSILSDTSFNLESELNG